MMQQAKKKLVLEHLVVHKMNTAADLKQVIATPQLIHATHSNWPVCMAPMIKPA